MSSGARRGCGRRASRAYDAVNRVSASAREAMTSRPRPASSRQSSGRSSRFSSRARLPAIDLIGRQRVVDLVAEDAHQPLPGLAFLFAQRAADVGEHEELVGEAALSEARAPDFPAAGAAGEGEFRHAGRGAVEARVEPELLGRAAEQAFRRRARAAARRRG